MNLWLSGEKGGGQEYCEFGIGMYTLIYLKQITNKDLLYIAQGTLLHIL